MDFVNTAKTLNIEFPGFKVSQATTPHYANSAKRVATVINSNLVFNSSIIKQNVVQIIFCVDNSGSMSQFVKGSFASRLSICKAALKETVKFLSFLGNEGKTIYISIISFCSDTTLDVDTVQINSTTLPDVLSSINNIQSKDTTNIGEAIAATEKLIQNNDKLQIEKNIKILLSDGYITTGSSANIIKDSYSGFFDTTVGIGKETDYDKELLQQLTKETDERSCMKDNEMKDHIVDSVFGNVSNMGTDFNITGNISSSNITIEDGSPSLETLSLTTYVFITYITNKNLEFTIQNVPATSIINSFEKLGSPSDKEDIYLFSPDYQTENDKCFVVYKYNEDTDTFDIKTTIIRDNESHKSQDNKQLYKIIDSFIDISNIFKTLKYDNPDNIIYKKLSDRIQSLYDHIKLYDCDMLYIKYIKSVLDEYNQSIKHLLLVVNTPGYSMDAYRTASAPMRMCSAQSCRSNFAFMGRLASVGYSQSYDKDSNPVNSQDSPSLQVSPPPQITPPPQTSPLPQITPPLQTSQLLHTIGPQLQQSDGQVYNSTGAFNIPPIPK